MLSASDLAGSFKQIASHLADNTSTQKSVQGPGSSRHHIHTVTAGSVTVRSAVAYYCSIRDSWRDKLLGLAGPFPAPKP